MNITGIMETEAVQAPAELFNAAGVKKISGEFPAKTFLHWNLPTVGVSEVGIFSYADETVPSAKALADMKTKGYRPATLFEFMRYLAKDPGIKLRRAVVVLGTIIESSIGDKIAIVDDSNMWATGRYLTAIVNDDSTGGLDCDFAVVKIPGLRFR